MSDALFVDALSPFLRSDDGATVLLRTTDPDIWFHAPTGARTARSPSGRYLLDLLRSRRHVDTGPEAGLVTIGGALAAQIHLVALAASAEQETAWAQLLERHGWSPAPGGRFDFLPLSLWKGRMTLGGVRVVSDDPAAGNPTTIGTPTSSAVSLRLTASGADALRAAIDAGSGPPVAVRFDYEYDARFSPVAYRVTADVPTVHAVLSRHPVACAGYYGSGGGQEPLDALCDELRLLDAVRIDWERTPDGLEPDRCAAVERAVLQRWIKRALDRLVESVEPDEQAPAGGSGGGGGLVRAPGGGGGVGSFRAPAPGGAGTP